ncbi:MAG: prolyl oligopeptidase family serine peptidase [bacterium]|nr:prolyl oligopeptidase family serine peptidase [bacterium]
MRPLNLEESAPWKARFRAPVVAATQIATLNPVYGLAVANISGIYQLHAWNVDTGELRQVTHSPAGVIFGGISPDGAYIYYHRDNGDGSEIGHWVRVPFAGGEEETLTPDLAPYSTRSISESLSGNMIGTNTASQDGFSMLLVQQDAQKRLQAPRLLYRSKRLSYGPLLTYDGAYAVIATTERSATMDHALYAFDVLEAESEATMKVLQEANGGLRMVAFAPVPGDSRLLAGTDVSGFERPLIWDVKTGDRTDIPLDDLEGDIYPLGWSPDGKRILLNHYYQAINQLYVYDLERSTLHRLNHPGGSISSAYFVNEAEIFANWTDATHPSQVIALSADTGELLRTVVTAGDSPAGRSWRSVTFTSTGGAPGGAQIQAWLAVPEGDGPFPTILHTHGGPTAVQTEVFAPSAQAWLDHGFAWMSVNYRGSVTFGREFEVAIHGNLGIHEVDDMEAAYHWLVSNGIAQPDAVLLTGGSYGGYLTLQALGRKPQLWAGGMAQVAIADWRLMYEDQAETLRGYQRSLFGGTPDEVPEQTRLSSPITYAEQIRAPILVIQGANDTRCPARQMRAYEERLQSLGKDIQIHWFDAGHGSRAMEQQIEHQELMLRWAYRVLG